MEVHIYEEERLPRDVDAEIIKWGCELIIPRRELDEDDPSFH